MTENKSDAMAALDEAIALFENMGAFAAAISTEELPVGQSKVSMWKTRNSVPADYVPAIYRETLRLGKPIDCDRLAPQVDWSSVRESEQPAQEVAAPTLGAERRHQANLPMQGTMSGQDVAAPLRAPEAEQAEAKVA